MRYGVYRKNGWFIGSGVIEAGCKTLVGKRLKQSGMFWSETGATGRPCARWCDPRMTEIPNLRQQFWAAKPFAPMHMAARLGAMRAK